MQGARQIGVLALVFFILIGLFLFFFGCSHYTNWWSLFILPVLIAAFIVPSLCYNYNAVEDIAFRADEHVDELTFRGCRELGWATAFVLLIFAYCVPVLAWYNDGFMYSGVLVEFGSITFFAYSYVLWLKIFVFVK